MIVKRAMAIWMGSFFSLACAAQQLDGAWKGTLSMRGCFLENNIELQIKMNGRSASGDSYHFQDIDNYVKKNFMGHFDPEQKKLKVAEGAVTTWHIPYHCSICVKEFDLYYSKEGKVEKLTGRWSGTVLNSSAGCSGGQIVLTRIKESSFKEIPEIKVDTGTIRLDFYDNAEIDGDSITVKVDKKIVLSNQRLTAKAITTLIRIDLSNTFHEVEMIANNEGSIPPNTAVLIITAGEKQHRLWLSAREEKSARVRFVYDPPIKDNAVTIR